MNNSQMIIEAMLTGLQFASVTFIILFAVQRMIDNSTNSKDK